MGSVVKAYCTIWGSWMSVRLLMRAWLRRASSFRRLSLCCSIILFSSSIVFRLHSIDDICFRVQKENNNKETRQIERAKISHLCAQNKRVRVDIYLGLKLHHVCFYFHVGFIQFLNLMIQMLNVFFVFNTWVEAYSLIYHVQAENTDAKMHVTAKILEYFHTTQRVGVAYHCWLSVW